jgi:hypothetical protein
MLLLLLDLLLLDLLLMPTSKRRSRLCLPIGQGRG